MACYARWHRNGTALLPTAQLGVASAGKKWLLAMIDFCYVSRMSK
jgi:hypothetical protein